MIRLQRIHNFLCSMLCYIMLLHVLYAFYIVYAFSGTNLLTRCHSASSLFSAVFGFRKVLKEINQPGIIFEIFASRRTEDETKKGREGPSLPAGAGPILAAPGGDEEPSGAHRLGLSPINTSLT